MCQPYNKSANCKPLLFSTAQLVRANRKLTKELSKLPEGAILTPYDDFDLLYHRRESLVLCALIQETIHTYEKNDVPLSEIGIAGTVAEHVRLLGALDLLAY